jgi:hypothetical protein
LLRLRSLPQLRMLKIRDIERVEEIQDQGGMLPEARALRV